MNKTSNNGIDLAKVNAKVSRRFALQGLLGGAAALFGMPALGVAQSTAPRPPSKLPAPKVGATEGAVKWATKFSAQIDDPTTITASSALHALGLAVWVFQDSTGNHVAVNDYYDGGTFQQFQFNGAISNPVFLPGPKVIVMAFGDSSFRTIVRNPDGSLNIQTVGVPGGNCVSNLCVVDDDTVVMVDSTNELQGIQFAPNGSSITMAFRQRPETQFPTIANLQVIDSGHFAFVRYDSTGSSSLYWMTRNSTLRGSSAKFAYGPFCVAGPYAYCLLDDGSNYWIQQFQLNPADGFQGWKTFLGLDSTGISNLTIANNALYFGFGNQFLSVQLDSGTKTAIEVGDGSKALNVNPILVEDGIAYVCTTDGYAYAVDLASNGVNQISYHDSASSSGSLGFSVGVENGHFALITTVNGQPSIAGIDLSGLLHGYTTDSVLMADDLVASTTNSDGYIPATPSYRTIVHITDENGAARANTSIRVEATDTVTLGSGSTTVTLTNPGDFQWFTTDQNGDLHLTCQADDIHSPALYLWGHFMDTSEAMVVYPDHVTLNNLKGKGPDDYSKAVGFDGTTTLFDQHQDFTSLSTTVSGLLGGGSTINPSTGPYAANGTSSNVVYQSQKSAAGRPMSAGDATSFTFSVDPNTNVVSHSDGGTPPVNPTASLLNWDNFKADVVKGLKKIKSAVIQIGDDISHWITTVDGAIYNFVVDTVEKAIGVISGLFKTILKDIKMAVEWLSALFDFKAILAVQKDIVGAVTTFQTNVRNCLNQEATSLKTLLTSFLNDGAQNVGTYFSNAATSLGGGTMASKQPNGGDPQQMFTNPAGQSSGAQPGAYAHSQAMHSKLTANIKKATKSSSLPSTSPFSPSQFVSQFKDVVTNQIPAALEAGGYADKLAQASKDLYSAMSTFSSNPSGSMKRTFADLLLIVGDAAALFLNAAVAVLDIVITLIADLLDTLVNILTGGFEVPVIGPIYKLVTGKDLTFLELVAFLVAVPAAIVMKISGGSVSGSQLGAESYWQIFAYSFSSMGGAVVDALSDTIAELGDDPICLVDLCFGLVTWGLSAPFSGFNGDAMAICYFAFGTIPLLVSAANAINYMLIGVDPTPDQLAECKLFANGCYGWQGTYGTLNLIFGIVGAVKDPSNFLGTGGSVLAGNCFSNAALMCKSFYPAVPNLTIATDVLFPFAAAFCNIAANVSD